MLLYKIINDMSEMSVSEQNSRKKHKGKRKIIHDLKNIDKEYTRAVARKAQQSQARSFVTD